MFFLVISSSSLVGWVSHRWRGAENMEGWGRGLKSTHEVRDPLSAKINIKYKLTHYCPILPYKWNADINSSFWCLDFFLEIISWKGSFFNEGGFIFQRKSFNFGWGVLFGEHLFWWKGHKNHGEGGSTFHVLH